MKMQNFCVCAGITQQNIIIINHHSAKPLN